MSTSETRCGAVSIIGLPNAGKSTLVNALVGTKVSITSRKVQTTRARILGIALKDQAQIVLIDTPGVFEPKKRMERAMVGAAFDAIAEGDCVLHLVDVTHKNVLENNKIILNKLPKGVPVILALNKVDRIEKTKLLDITAELNAAFDYEQTFMISALKGSGLKDLMGYLANKMPEGPWHYDEDQITTMPLRMWAAEITREKIFEQLHKELPYAILVETELWEDFDNGDLKISQAITVERTSQKAIILGKGGSRIREIGKAARLDLEDQLERRVHMKLFVRVQENWQDRPESYQIMGLSE